MREQGLCDRRDLPRAGIADDRSFDAGHPLPVHARRRIRLGLVAAHQREDVSRLGIRHRHARVRRRADRRRDSGDNLERHPLLVQEQRFLAAAVEHEGVPPLQADDALVLARLLGEQDRNRLLVERPDPAKQLHPGFFVHVVHADEVHHVGFTL